MATSIDYADMFNRKLGEFLSDLEAIGIDSVPEYPMLKASAQMMAKFDKSKMPIIFNSFVLNQYESQIMAQDEAFFLDQQFTNNTNDFAIVSAIKKIWSSLDDVNKNAIWAHLRVLTVLCKKCTSA